MTGQINAECGYCGKGIMVTGDGSRPTSRANNEDRLIFCDHACAMAWLHEPHCGWCGATAKTGALTVEVTEGAERHFCTAEHYRAYLEQYPPHLRVVT